MQAGERGDEYCVCVCVHMCVLYDRFGNCVLGVRVNCRLLKLDAFIFKNKKCKERTFNFPPQPSMCFHDVHTFLSTRVKVELTIP